MTEMIFLGIAGAAGAFKALAILVGVVWAFRGILMQRSAQLDYRYTHAELPFRHQTVRK
jgi:hypothetical protein